MPIKKILALAAVLSLTACASYTWAPPPGGSSITFNQQAAQCRLFARGDAPTGGGFYASGSPRFVGTAMGAYALGSVIGSAIHQQADFNDCMSASGWIPVGPVHS
jgi:hypothetical protein